MENKKNNIIVVLLVVIIAQFIFIYHHTFKFNVISEFTLIDDKLDNKLDYGDGVLDGEKIMLLYLIESNQVELSEIDLYKLKIEDDGKKTDN